MKKKAKLYLKLISSKMKYINFINASFLVYGVVFIKGVLTRRIITPDEFGYFINAQLIITYGMYMQLGVLNALNFEIPGLEARANQNELDKTIGSSKAYIICISVLSLIMIPIVLTFDIDSKLKYGYAITLIILSINLWVGMGENILRGYQEFSKLSKIMIIKSVSTLIISVALTYFIGYYGLYFGLLAGNVMALLFMINRINIYKPIFKVILIFKRIKNGLPIFVTGMLWSLLLAIGQTIGFMKLTNTEMGEFSITIMIYSTIMIFPSIISQIVYPKILILTSNSNNEIKLVDFYNSFFELYSRILIIISILSLLIIPELISMVLPKYLGGISSSLILLLSMYVIAINGLNTNVITGFRKAKRLTMHLTIALILMIVMEYMLIDSLGIDAISFALLTAFLVYSCLNSIYIIKELKLPVARLNMSFAISFVFYIVPVFLLLYFHLNFSAILYGGAIIMVNFIKIVKRLRGRIYEE